MERGDSRDSQSACRKDRNHEDLSPQRHLQIPDWFHWKNEYHKVGDGVYNTTRLIQGVDIDTVASNKWIPCSLARNTGNDRQDEVDKIENGHAPHADMDCNKQ